jgi:hypothetical protein
MHTIRVVPWHNEDVHLLEQAGSPGGVCIHLAQKRHSTLIGGWLIAMNGRLKPYAEFCGI